MRTTERRVDAGHRLVEQHERRFGHQRPRDFEQLALAARKRAGIVLRLGAQAECFEQTLRIARVRALRPLRARRGPRDQQRADARRAVAARRAACCRSPTCPRGPGSAGRCAPGRAARSGAAPAADCTGRRSGWRRESGRGETADQIEHRRLAGAVRADQRGDRAALDAEAGAVDGAQAVESLDRIADCPGWRRRSRPHLHLVAIAEQALRPQPAEQHAGTGRR